MALNDTDYLRQFQALLPPGPAWPRGDDATLTRLFGALAVGLARVDQRARQLIDESDPRTTVELLADWERVAGLPEPLQALASTLQQRRGELVSKVTALGGQSIAYFVAYAAKLGFPIAIAEFSPWRMGMTRMGSPLGGPEWAYAWAVDAGPVNITSFRMGLSAMGEPLQIWGNDVLEASLRRVAPAHTLVIFRYPLADAALGPFVLDSGQLA